MTPPNVLAKVDMSKESIVDIPLLPLVMPSQVSGTVLPMDVTAPNPVITTRRLVNEMHRKKIKDGYNKVETQR